MILSTLRLVRGAVATKELVPTLTHFHIYNGRIQGGNGRLAIDAPCPELPINGTVPAERFLKAVDACGGEPNLSVTEGGKLSIKRGKFRALLPLAPHDAYPRLEPQGEPHDFKPGLLEALRLIAPFVSTDASRPWACSALMRDGFIWATNNVALVRVPYAWDGTSCAIPNFAIDELLRIGRPIRRGFVSEGSVTFDLGDGAWMRTQMFSDGWPNLEGRVQVGTPPPVPPGLSEAITKLLPFCPDPGFPVIQFVDGVVKTREGEMSAEVEGENLPAARFNADPLLTVLAHCTHIDFSTWPMPSPFRHETTGLEGVVVGVK